MGRRRRKPMESQEQRPAPRQAEMQLFDLKIMREQLEGRIGQRWERKRFDLTKATAPKYSPRWRGKGGVFWNLASLKSNQAENWLILHPVKLFRAMTTSKTGTGVRGFIRARRQFSKVMKRQERYLQPLEEIHQNLKSEAMAAFEELATAVRSGQVSWENRNHYLQRYEKALRAAEEKFDQAHTTLLNKYIKERKARAKIRERVVRTARSRQRAGTEPKIVRINPEADEQAREAA